jgi:putative protease
MEKKLRSPEKAGKVPELLAPAGNMECLNAAFRYGADAAYIAAKRFGLRAYADNFEPDEISQAAKYAHKFGKKIYVTMNIFAHNKDLEDLDRYVKSLSDAEVDAVIVSDPGIIAYLLDFNPSFDIHLSTQANTTNWRSASFWHSLGVKRIILSRELSLNEIVNIRQNTPRSLELECFVHGSMCIAYSGRCALSNYLTGRDANRGECAQACRWKYYLSEEKRPGEFMPVSEDDRGTYILNSKDLCMIKHIKQLAKAGIDSFKIEGRMKGVYYVASVVRAYRHELDAYAEDPDSYRYNELSCSELEKVSHRRYTTGFYFKTPDCEAAVYESSSYIRAYDFIGLVLDYVVGENLMLVEQRNNFAVGDEVEIILPDSISYVPYTVYKMYDEHKNPIIIAPHAQQKLFLPVPFEVPPFSMLRKK